MDVLGYLPKLKRGLGLASGAYFLHDFLTKMFPIQYGINWQSSMSYLFSFSIYQTKCIIKFLFRQFLTSRILTFIFDYLPSQWLTGKKEGKTEIHEFEYFENEKSFLDEMKNIVHNYLKAFI